MSRRPSLTDRLIAHLEHALATSAGPPPAARRPYPAASSDTGAASLSPDARRHAAGLMRVNHAGEVCAQALYLGQATVARDAATRAQLLEAAAEEGDHLAWCARRLDELGSHPSRLNGLWYAGSYAIGVLAALRGDATSLGFIVETERQVEAHLATHLERLPSGDAPSRAVVAQMRDDEAAHGRRAQEAGAQALPEPVPKLMAAAAAVMKWAAYRW